MADSVRPAALPLKESDRTALITGRRLKPDRLIGPAFSAARRHLGTGDRNGCSSNLLLAGNYGSSLESIAPGPPLAEW
jgi:hypothetical protein